MHLADMLTAACPTLESMKGFLRELQKKDNTFTKVKLSSCTSEQMASKSGKDVEIMSTSRKAYEAAGIVESIEKEVKCEQNFIVWGTEGQGLQGFWSPPSSPPLAPSSLLRERRLSP